MKRDIRELFNIEEDIKHELSPNHREDFLSKLNAKESPKSNKMFWLKIAAVFVVALSVGYFVFDREEAEDISPLVAQIEAVEAEYLDSIHAEWINFIAATNDENLVKRYEQKLTDLDNDYQEISEAFKSDTNNILVVELLIANLQTRLELLKDIQEHIKILNQKNEHNENTI
ncbi:hypothetical protein [uncultured Winogradskyella sp.]|uniref:hypothetical protein n=1 Tax=uncultured Winogradskyella sp. TaxID=395353 RepID=UPI002628C24D|nr:hypothetical protein [uncultured Winogradskyella sp.]